MTTQNKNERRSNEDYLQEVWDSLEPAWDKSKFDMKQGYDSEYECDCITITSKDNEGVLAKIYVNDYEGRHPVGFDVVYRYPGDKGVGVMGSYEFQSTDMDGLGEEVFDYFDEIKQKVGESMNKNNFYSEDEVLRVLTGLIESDEFRKVMGTSVLVNDIEDNLEELQNAFLDSFYFDDGSFKYDVTVENSADGEVDHGPMFDACADVTDKVLEILGLPDSCWNTVQEYLFYNGVSENIVSESKKNETNSHEEEAVKKVLMDASADAEFRREAGKDFSAEDFEKSIDANIEKLRDVFLEVLYFDDGSFKCDVNDHEETRELCSFVASKVAYILGLSDSVATAIDGYLLWYVVQENIVSDESKKSEDTLTNEKLARGYNITSKLINTALDYGYDYYDGMVATPEEHNKLFNTLMDYFAKQPSSIQKGSNDQVLSLLKAKLKEILDSRKNEYPNSESKKSEADGNKDIFTLDLTRIDADGDEEGLDDMPAAQTFYDEDDAIKAAKELADSYKDDDGVVQVIVMAGEQEKPNGDIVGDSFDIYWASSSNKQKTADYRKKARYAAFDNKMDYYANGGTSEAKKSEVNDEEAFGKFEDAVKSILMDKYGVVDSHGPSDETANSLVLQYGATLRDAFDKGGDNGYDPTSVALLIITRQLREAPQFFDDCKDFTFNTDSKNSESRKSEDASVHELEFVDIDKVYSASDFDDLVYKVALSVQLEVDTDNVEQGVLPNDIILTARGYNTATFDFEVDKIVKQLAGTGIVLMVDGVIKNEDTYAKKSEGLPPKKLGDREYRSRADLINKMKQVGATEITTRDQYDELRSKQWLHKGGYAMDINGNLVGQTYFGDKDGKWYYATTKTFQGDYLPECKEAKKSESLTLKQKELKDMARFGQAEDITTISDAEAKELKKKGIETVGISRGTYGMNGALLRDSEGNKYVITARSSNLFYFV